ncbi:hypothetical protein A3F66_06235 [candidate division TM6 bacterium RIFCSPHIGHO2_12_FULL_32_22]|nr:MAG: hypothetical protein A3F66_06235 [candidate division TM6 bacterium RIFCSPHIGHO2_12_FULL_32_22]
MQLYACCESIEKYLINYGKVQIICRADPDFRTSYSEVEKAFNDFEFIYQGNRPEQDFKTNVMRALSKCGEYMMFAVDDNIVIDYLDLSECAQALEKYKAYAFLLRLGKNINFSYMLKKLCPLPQHTQEDKNICSYMFRYGSLDWAYPNNVDMTIYRTQNVIAELKKLAFKHPWSLEGSWTRNANLNLRGLFFNEPRIINLNINLVAKENNSWKFNSEWQKKYQNYSLNVLLQKFKDGYKIDISKFYKYKINTVHISSEPDFVKSK